MNNPSETKQAICSKCGRKFNHRIPADAEEVTCFWCDYYSNEKKEELEK